MNYNYTKFKLFKLFYILPILIISGPFLPDLLISLSTIFFLYYFPKYQPQYLRNKFFTNFLILYLFLVSISFLSIDVYKSLKSTLPYFRFFIYSLIIYFLLDKKILNISNFYKIISIVLIILFFDTLFQFIFGENIFGLKSPLKYRLTSFFGDEAKLGSYTFRILVLYIFLDSLVQINYKKIVSPIIILSSILIIILSGDRTPLILLIIYLFLLNLYNFKKYFIYFILLFIFLISILSFSNILKNRIVYMSYEGFFKTLENFNQDKIDKKIDYNFNENKKFQYYISDDHHQHMVTSIKIFKDNLIFGSGPNTFRFLCSDKRYYVKQNSCSTHPHNYYLQLLSEVGIILPLIFLIIFCLVSLKILKLILFKKTDQDIQEYLILLHIFIILFPLSPNGNFFNNWLNISNFLPFGFYIYYLKKIKKS